MLGLVTATYQGKAGKNIVCSRKTMELSKIVYPRSKMFVMANEEEERDQWLGGIML